jgi:ketopantoate reductase
MTWTYEIHDKGTLVGVYNKNKGYADFRQIQILYQNDEYSIVKSNTDYGLIEYDYIVLDAKTVDDDELLN